MRKSIGVALALLLLGSYGIPTTMAAGLIDPFSRDGVDFDPQEWTLIKEAIAKVLAVNTAGAQASWEYAKTDRAGQAKVIRVFKSKGLNCAEVEHSFTKGTGSRYVMPFCRVADGSWKVAF